MSITMFKEPSFSSPTPADQERLKAEKLERILERYQAPLLAKFGEHFKSQMDPAASIRVDGIALDELDLEALTNITGLMVELEGEYLFGNTDEERRESLVIRTRQMIDHAVNRAHLSADQIVRADGTIAWPKDREISFDVVPNAQHLMLLCPDELPEHWTDYAVYLSYGHVRAYRGMVENNDYVRNHVEPAALCGLPLGYQEQELLKRFKRHELPEKS